MESVYIFFSKAVAEMETLISKMTQQQGKTPL